MSGEAQPLVIVDDTTEDLDIFARLVLKAGIANPLWRFEHGEDAIMRLSELTREAHENTSPLPITVFLDLKTPDFGGLEILQWIRAHEVFARVGVVICSGSEDPEDWQRAAREGAQAFVGKFPTAEQMRELLACARKFGAGESNAFDVSYNRLVRS